jgi:ParB family chromosome partitioning protein
MIETCVYWLSSRTSNAATWTPIEKAQSFQELKEQSGLTHQQLAKEVGLERSSVSNYLRLLELPSAVRDRIRRKELSMGHARAILAADPSEQVRLATLVAEQSLSVRECERLARDGLAQKTPELSSSADPRPERAPSSKAAWARDMEDQLRTVLGCNVRVSYRKGRGRIQLEIGSREEFDRIYELLTDKLPS